MIPNPKLREKKIWPTASTHVVAEVNCEKFGENKYSNPDADPSNVIPLIPSITNNIVGKGTVQATVLPTLDVPFLKIK